MKNTIVILTLSIVVLGQTAYANLNDQTETKKNQVQWTGVVKDDDFYHTTDHRHQLEFIRDKDGESFDIVDSKKLVQLHHEEERDLRVQITGEITPRFLFWGGNLVVKDYKVLAGLSQKPHLKPNRNPLQREHGR